MNKIIKLSDEVSYQEGQIVSKTLVQNAHISITIFSFWKNEEIGSHESKGDAMVTVIDGIGKFIVGKDVHLVKSNETLIMPSGIPHAVFAEENFKMVLSVIF